MWDDYYTSLACITEKLTVCRVIPDHSRVYWSHLEL